MRPLKSTPVALGLILLLNGCASTAPTPGDHAAESQQPYFTGIESEFSRRLSSLPSDEGLPPSSVMHEAMIAGDGELYVTATLYQANDHVAMDLIVLNHGEATVAIARKDIRLVDSSGRFFETVEDFEGASNFGLRSRRARQASAQLYSSPMDVRMPDEYRSLSARDNKAQKGSMPPESASVPQRSTIRGWQPTAPPVHEIPNAPAVVQVSARQGRAYWVYWAPPLDPVFPLTAFVMLGDRHVQFQFDDSGMH